MVRPVMRMFVNGMVAPTVTVADVVCSFTFGWMFEASASETGTVRKRMSRSQRVVVIFGDFNSTTLLYQYCTIWMLPTNSLAVTPPVAPLIMLTTI